MDGICKAVAKIICRIPGTEQKVFIKNLRYWIANEAMNMHPSYSDCQLAQVTGIARTKLSSYRKEERRAYIMSKDSIILSELWNKKNKNNIIPMSGKNSFYVIAKNILRGSYKPQSTLTSLIDCEAVELVEQGLLINTYVLESNKNDKMLCELADIVFERYACTLLHNFSDTKNKLFDVTYTTTKIKPKDLLQVKVLIKKYLNQIVLPHVKDVIDNAESNVNVDTYPAYSLSLFEYVESNSKPKR